MRGAQLMLPIVGRQADPWHAWGSVADLKSKWDIVSEHVEKADRNPDDIVRATGLSLSEPWDEVRAPYRRVRGRRLVLSNGVVAVGGPRPPRGIHRPGHARLRRIALPCVGGGDSRPLLWGLLCCSARCAWEEAGAGRAARAGAV